MATAIKPEIDLVKLFTQYGSDEACRNYLEALRWPEGVECPNCGGKSISRIKTRKQFDCNACRKRFSVTTGTVFHDSHLSLPKWFAAVFLMTEAKKGMSANQLRRTLGVAHKTAWYLCHRIRSAMVEEHTERLGGVVEIDETYVGGKRHKGGWMGNKTMVVGAIERDGRLRVEAQPNASHHHIREFVAENVDTDATVYTDEHKAYRELSNHHTVNHSQDEYVRGQVHTNTVESAWSLFDRAVIGSFHNISKKHLPAYLDEFEFRFNNRENPYLFRDTIKRMIAGDTLTYKELTASSG
jgi:transposase-like protein